MNIGGTAKKLQQVVDAADELYAKINDLKSDLAAIRDTIAQTNDRVAALETELAEQRELLEAVAKAEDVDIDQFQTDFENETETE